MSTPTSKDPNDKYTGPKTLKDDSSPREALKLVGKWKTENPNQGAPMDVAVDNINTEVRGTQGTQGAQGTQGVQGTQGMDIAVGNSVQGAQGAQGAQGMDIAVGNTAQGAQGVQGNQGEQGAQGMEIDVKTVELPQSKEEYFKNFIKDNCPEIEGSTTFVSPYDLDHHPDSKNLKESFNLLKLMLEILDGSHDLACDKDQRNPLIDYCINKNIEVVDLENYRSQTAIKNKMKEIIQNIPDYLNIALNRQKYADSSFETIGKKLEALQTFLNDPHSKNDKSPKLSIAIIETHRGGMPVNKDIRDRNSPQRCDMFKSKLSTIFDLNASEQMTILEIGEIKNTIKDCKKSYHGNETKIDIVRRFGNPFPMSFSIFIKKSEILNRASLRGILRGINKTNYPDENYESHAEEIFDIIKRNPQNFFDGSDDNTLYLLHMFTDIDNRTPTFSLQKDAVTADQVTTALFGIKKRNCLSFSKVKPLTQSLLLLSRMTKKTEESHIIYAKTCGDGVAIEIVRIYSYLLENTVGLLSSDVCCNYRNLLDNGYSVRQLPTKLAGTGLGRLLTTERQIEIYKNVEINPPSILGNIDKIFKNYNDNNVKINHIDSFKVKYINLLLGNKSNLQELNKDDENAVQFLNDIAKTYINENFDKNLKRDNTYVEHILEIAIYKFAIDVYENISNEINTYKDMLEMNFANAENFCYKIKSFCTSSVLIYSAEDQITSLVKDFMNRFINLTSLLTDFTNNMQFSRDNEINEKIENNIKIITSIENLFETIKIKKNIEGYEDSIKLMLKTHVLFNLVLPMENKVGIRIFDKYSKNIIEKINQFRSKNEGFNNELKKQIVGNVNFDSLDITNQYKSLVNAFDQKYGQVKTSNPLYFEKQELKQPLTLLKYILRIQNAIDNMKEERFSNNLKKFKIFDEKYTKIVKDLSSVCNTPAASQISQSQSQSQYTGGQPPPGSEIEMSVFPSSSVSPLPDDSDDSVDTGYYTPPVATATGAQNRGVIFCADPKDEEDLSTVLSPLDDNVINRYDMDEDEVEDFYRENDLDLNEDNNLKIMIAKTITNIMNNNIDPSIIFDYKIAEKTKRNENFDEFLKDQATVNEKKGQIIEILTRFGSGCTREINSIFTPEHSEVNMEHDDNNQHASEEDHYKTFNYDFLLHDKNMDDTNEYKYESVSKSGPVGITFENDDNDDVILYGDYDVIEFNYKKKYLNDDDDKWVAIKVTNYYPVPKDGTRLPVSIREITIPRTREPIKQVSTDGRFFMNGGKKHKKTRKYKKKKRNTIRNK